MKGRTLLGVGSGDAGCDQAYVHIGRRPRTSPSSFISCNQGGTRIIIIIIIIYISSWGVFDLCLYCALPRPLRVAGHGVTGGR